MFNSSNSFLVSGITTNKNLQDAQLNLNKNYSFITSKMNSINLFPTEDKQTLKAEKLRFQFSFSSYSSYITISDSSDWNIGTSDFAIEMWINSDANGSFALFNHYESSNVDLRIIHHDVLGLLFYVNNTTYPTNGQSAVTLTANVWHHIVFTRVASTLKYYLDKLVVATQASFTTNIQDYSGALEIGRVEQSTVFDGEIAITRFYVGRGLSEKEVLQNFNAQRGRFGV